MALTVKDKKRSRQKEPSKKPARSSGASLKKYLDTESSEKVKEDTINKRKSVGLSSMETKINHETESSVDEMADIEDCGMADFGDKEAINISVISSRLTTSPQDEGISM